MALLKLKYLAVSLALFFALTLCFERPAYAYVDPGSSLLAFQTLSATLTGGLFYFRRRIKALLLNLKINSMNPKPGETAATPARLTH